MMDETDRKLLQALKENARISAADLGEKVGLPAAEAQERVRRLETAGIIEKYTLSLNQQKLGNEVSALLEVCLAHPKYFDRFTRKICEMEEVEECYYMTGEYDFMLKISTRSAAALERLHRTVKSMNGVSGTKMFVVLQEMKKA